MKNFLKIRTNKTIFFIFSLIIIAYLQFDCGNEAQEIYITFSFVDQFGNSVNELELKIGDEPKTTDQQGRISYKERIETKLKVDFGNDEEREKYEFINPREIELIKNEDSKFVFTLLKKKEINFSTHKIEGGKTSSLQDIEIKQEDRNETLCKTDESGKVTKYFDPELLNTLTFYAVHEGEKRAKNVDFINSTFPIDVEFRFNIDGGGRANLKIVSMGYPFKIIKPKVEDQGYKTPQIITISNSNTSLLIETRDKIKYKIELPKVFKGGKDYELECYLDRRLRAVLWDGSRSKGETIKNRIQIHKVK